jgi:predicted GNAT family acetyltransferase
MTETVTDNPTQNRFEMLVDGETAAVYYRHEGDNLVLVHTEVPQALSGRGIGSKLAQGVFDRIRADGHKAIVTCPFLVKWASRHPEINDLVVG